MAPISSSNNFSTEKVLNMDSNQQNHFKHMVEFPQHDSNIAQIYRPLPITFIEYPDGDTVGFILAWFSMLPLIYIVSLCTLISFRRDIQTIMYLSGFFVNGMINHTLKNIIKQARPPRTRDRMGPLEVYGMPSGHAQLIFYFMTYLSLLYIMKSQAESEKYKRLIQNRFKLSFFTAIAILVAYSRVYLYYHTTLQVIVGAFIGISFACVWYYLVNYKIYRMVPFIIDHSFVKFFQIRDYSPIEDLLRFQYESETAEAKRCRDRSTNYSRDQNLLISIQ